MVFIDYNSICRIVYYSILNMISIDRINYQFINVLIYLSVYLFDVHYILGRLNYVLDVLLYFRVVGDKVI